MTRMSIDLPEDVFWYVYAAGAKKQVKAHQQVEEIIVRWVEQDREVNQDTVTEEVA